MLDKYTAFDGFVKTTATRRMDQCGRPKNHGFMRFSSSCPPKTRYSWRGSLLRFVDSFIHEVLAMTEHPKPSTSQTSKRPEKSGFLSLSQISELMAQGAADQHKQLTEAHSSQVYATDLDEFVDFHARQSVNVNPSKEQGVHP